MGLQRIAALSAVRQVALRYHGISPNMVEENVLAPSPPLRGGAASSANDGQGSRSIPRVPGDKLPVVVRNMRGGRLRSHSLLVFS